MQLRVYYEDTDTGGVVYHSNYLNFCERARSELFFQKGLSPHQENAFFVVTHIDAKFVKPALLGDILHIKTSLLQIKQASLSMSQNIYRNEDLIFKAIVKVAYLKNGRPSKIPSDMLDIFKGSK
ncbi:MAG: YbgC/FadM family acyl-CoA thioesterase [Campylobacteraceae bacterium]|nr:YbgC/FadM family acyl-CoA thioesterase [Campylobacteraceae bacterium]